MFRFCYILISIGRDFYFLIFDLEELKFSEVFRKFGRNIYTGEINGFLELLGGKML